MGEMQSTGILLNSGKKENQLPFMKTTGTNRLTFCRAAGLTWSTALAAARVYGP